MSAVLAAVNTSGLVTGIEGVLVVGVGIGLAFCAYKLVKKAMGRM